MILTVRCPKCRNSMKYQPRDRRITKKVKKCVYCGRSFKIHTSPNKSRIV